jgi:hypothetical protein
MMMAVLALVVGQHLVSLPALVQLCAPHGQRQHLTGCISNCVFVCCLLGPPQVGTTLTPLTPHLSLPLLGRHPLLNACHL